VQLHKPNNADTMCGLLQLKRCTKSWHSASDPPSGSAQDMNPKHLIRQNERHSDAPMRSEPPQRADPPRKPGSSGPRRPPRGGTEPPSPYRMTPLWWLILIALGLWNLWAFFPRQNSDLTLTYSSFIAQLRGGNVAQVHLSGETITGSFKEPVVW